MSQSAPQPHPLESDSDQSLSPKLMSEEDVVREVVVNGRHVQSIQTDQLFFLKVQRTISLTSENPSEAFFSADEDMHSASRSSSLRTGNIDRIKVPQKKRFASDLRYQ